LYYDDLSYSAREQLWRAFLEKTRNRRLGLQNLTPDEMRKLSNKRLNGRQIKNVIKLAVALADHENATLTFRHLAQTTGTVEGSTAEGWFHSAKGLLRYLGLG
jgi:hypothetical protein